MLTILDLVFLILFPGKQDAFRNNASATCKVTQIRASSLESRNLNFGIRKFYSSGMFESNHYQLIFMSTESSWNRLSGHWALLIVRVSIYRILVGGQRTYEMILSDISLHEICKSNKNLLKIICSAFETENLKV